MPDRPLLTATLTRSIALSAETRHLEFTTSAPLDFTPGQFISVVQTNAESKEITRAYSLASPPCSDGGFAFCLNRVVGGFMSNFLCDLREGDQIRWHGPHGLFTFRPPMRDALLIATGTGIAPFRSMAHWLFADPVRHSGAEFWLIYGTRYPDHIYYRDEFEQIARDHPNFHYIVTLSRADENWPGPRGYVQERAREILAQRPNHGVAQMQAYICGLNAMVSSVREHLKLLDWDRKQIIYERYD